MTKTLVPPRRLAHRLISWAAQLAILLLLVLALEAFLGRAQMGAMAPPLDALTLEQKSFSLQQFRGQPAVVHFWASWCPVCELEQGAIDQLARDIPIITVAMQSGSLGEVRAYLAQQGVSYSVVNDERGGIAQRYGVKAVPASFILDGSGRVRFTTRGYTTSWGLRTRLWLAGFF